MFRAARLKKLRKDLGLSQVQMGEKLNIEQATYCKYETNRSDLSLHLLQKLKDEFGIDPNEFLNISNPNTHQKTETMASETDKISEGVENYDTVVQNILNATLANQQILLKSQQTIIELITLIINKPKNKKAISKKL